MIKNLSIICADAERNYGLSQAAVDRIAASLPRLPATTGRRRPPPHQRPPSR